MYNQISVRLNKTTAVVEISYKYFNWDVNRLCLLTHYSYPNPNDVMFRVP